MEINRKRHFKVRTTFETFQALRSFLHFVSIDCIYSINTGDCIEFRRGAKKSENPKVSHEEHTTLFGRWNSKNCKTNSQRRERNEKGIV